MHVCAHTCLIKKGSLAFVENLKPNHTNVGRQKQLQVQQQLSLLSTEFMLLCKPWPQWGSSSQVKVLPTHLSSSHDMTGYTHPIVPMGTEHGPRQMTSDLWEIPLPHSPTNLRYKFFCLRIPLEKNGKTQMILSKDVKKAGVQEIKHRNLRCLNTF